MIVTVFNKKDILEVNSWYEKRGLPKLEEKSFPVNGCVISGVGALFVYLTDSNIALIEGLITNPEVSFIKRARAVKALVNVAQNIAKNFRDRIVVIIKGESVLKLALSLSYKKLGQYELLVKG